MKEVKTILIGTSKYGKFKKISKDAFIIEHGGTLWKK